MDAELQAARRSAETDPDRLRKVLLRAGMYQNFPRVLFRVGDVVIRVRETEHFDQGFPIGATGTILPAQDGDPSDNIRVIHRAIAHRETGYLYTAETCDLHTPASED